VVRGKQVHLGDSELFAHPSLLGTDAKSTHRVDSTDEHGLMAVGQRTGAGLGWHADKGVQVDVQDLFVDWSCAGKCGSKVNPPKH